MRKVIALLAKYLVDWTVSEHKSSKVIRIEGDANDDSDDDVKSPSNVAERWSILSVTSV